MGCLNATGRFPHWFGNIHLSGPCNRSCYFCIGQHMMAQDPHDVLDSFPLPGLGVFLERCAEHEVREVNLTGSNTDPLLYRRIPALVALLRAKIPGVRIGCRTNGALILGRSADWSQFDKASVSVTSFDPVLYRRTMGNGSPPDIEAIIAASGHLRLKANVVLCPEILPDDIWRTLRRLSDAGITTVNLREPYGQPHIGDPIARSAPQVATTFGMPTYSLFGMSVTYWDVHYVEVESVNLYADGRVSVMYPVTRGCAPDGTVQDQSKFTKSGRVRDQWVTLRVAAPFTYPISPYGPMQP